MVQSGTIRVMIVDDFDMLRAGLKFAIEQTQDLMVIAEARGGEEAIRLCRQHAPDIVLMDMMMPDMNGIETTQRILEDNANIKIIALTSSADNETIHEAMKVGVIGYLLKNITGDALAKAIREAHMGQSPLAQEAIQVLMQKPSHETPGSDITPAERRVLELLVQGLSNREIAHTLFISTSTVKNHVSSLLHKLNVKNRAGAVAVAVQHKLVPPKASSHEDT